MTTTPREPNDPADNGNEQSGELNNNANDRPAETVASDDNHDKVERVKSEPVAERTEPTETVVHDETVVTDGTATAVDTPAHGESVVTPAPVADGHVHDRAVHADPITGERVVDDGVRVTETHHEDNYRDDRDPTAWWPWALLAGLALLGLLFYFLFLAGSNDEKREADRARPAVTQTVTSTVTQEATQTPSESTVTMTPEARTETVTAPPVTNTQTVTAEPSPAETVTATTTVTVAPQN